MKISGRNQLKGTIKSVKIGTIMAQVVLELDGGQEVVSAITADSARDLDLRVGDTVFALIKSTEVMIGKD